MTYAPADKTKSTPEPSRPEATRLAIPQFVDNRTSTTAQLVTQKMMLEHSGVSGVLQAMTVGRRLDYEHKLGEDNILNGQVLNFEHYDPKANLLSPEGGNDILKQDFLDEVGVLLKKELARIIKSKKGRSRPLFETPHVAVSFHNKKVRLAINDNSAWKSKSRDDQLKIRDLLKTEFVNAFVSLERQDKYAPINDWLNKYNGKEADVLTGDLNPEIKEGEKKVKEPNKPFLMESS